MQKKSKLLIVNYIIFITIYFLCNVIWSQNSETELNGTIIDNNTSDPIVGATIYIYGFNKAIYSDKVGKFRLIDIKPGIYELTILYPSYFKLSAKVKIYKGEENYLTFKLKKNEEYETSRTIVFGERDKPKISRKTITRDELKVIPGNTGDAVKAVITSFPGIVLGNSFSSAFFIVRGGEPTDNVIYFDNIWILSAFHFGGFVSIFNSDALESIDFYAGGFPAGFGNVMGSVMDIHSTRMASTKLTGKLNVSLLTADALIEGPLSENLYFQFSTRRSYFDLFVPYLINIDFDTFPYFWDYYGKITYTPSKNHYIDILTIGSSDQLKFNIDASLTDSDIAQGEANFDNIFYSNGINYQYIPNNYIFNNLTLGWLKYDVGVQFGTDPITKQPFKLLLSMNFFSLRDNFHVQFNRYYEVDTGPYILFSYMPFEFNAPRVPEEGETTQNIGDLGPTMTVKDTFIAYNLNYFIRNTLTLGNWKFVIGPEINYYNMNKYLSISPRASFEWVFFKDWTLLGAWGLYFQNPQPTELYREDDSLKSQMCYHYIIGLEYQITKDLVAKLEGYFKYYYNLIIFDHSEVIRDESNNIEDVVNHYNNNGRGIAYGGELFIKHSLYKGFFAWLSYTYAVSKRKNHPVEEYRLSQWDQTHILTLIGSYEFLDHFKVGAKWRVNSGLPYTARIGRVRITPQTTPEAEYEGLFPEEQYTSRYPIKHQLDVRFDYFTNVWIGQMTVYLELLNAYNQDNVSRYRYYRDFSNYDSPIETYDLPLIPYIGVEYKF